MKSDLPFDEPPPGLAYVTLWPVFALYATVADARNCCGNVAPEPLALSADATPPVASTPVAAMLATAMNLRRFRMFDCSFCCSRIDKPKSNNTRLHPNCPSVKGSPTLSELCVNESAELALNVICRARIFRCGEHSACFICLNQVARATVGEEESAIVADAACLLHVVGNDDHSDFLS